MEARFDLSLQRLNCKSTEKKLKLIESKFKKFLETNVSETHNRHKDLKKSKLVCNNSGSQLSLNFLRLSHKTTKITTNTGRSQNFTNISTTPQCSSHHIYLKNVICMNCKSTVASQLKIKRVLPYKKTSDKWQLNEYKN